MTIFDKAGNPIGILTVYQISTPRKRTLSDMRGSNPGNMQFFVPIKIAGLDNPELVLIDDDRLVYVQSELGEPGWAGTIGPQDGSEGVITVQVDDVQATWASVGVKLDAIVPDATPATAIYQQIVDQMNATRGAVGEIQWGTDLAGSKVFHGDLDYEGDFAGALEMVAQRSNTEYAWKAAVGGGGALELTLVVRDAFSVAGTVGIADGPGGNVVSAPRIVRDPTPLVHKVTLRGRATEITNLVPEWAQWAVHEVEPEITVSVDPGTHRLREPGDSSVDWSLSHSEQDALAQQTLEKVWELYRSHLRAIHDIQGRPFHEGWKYEGPPDIYEPRTAGKDSLSRRAWHTRLQLVETFAGVPATAVMISDNSVTLNLREWLIVNYDRVTGVQTVSTWAITLVPGASLVHWNTTGTVTIYRVSGGRVVETATLPGGTGAFVAQYSVSIRAGILGPGYVTLRQIINGPYALAWWIHPSDANNNLVDLGPDAAVDQAEGDGSSFIDKMYDFEQLAIADWDPRRDGIGALLDRPTIFNGAVTTRPRWHRVSFDVGSDANTTLTAGISAASTVLAVESIYGFPEPEVVPFSVVLDMGSPDPETVIVTDMEGSQWTVTRGANARIHEAGATVDAAAGAVFDGFTFPSAGWPAGEAWATELLAKLSVPKWTIAVRVVDAALQAEIDYGSIHPIDIDSEWVAGGLHGDCRVLGWAPDEVTGPWELFVEYPA